MKLDGIKDFLDVQRQYSDLLISLYSYRNLGGVSYDSALELLGGEEKSADAKLRNFLTIRKLGLDTEGGILLDPVLRDAYERVLSTNRNISEEAISRIRPDVERLCEQWDSCTDSSDKRYIVTELYRTLDRIPSGLQQSVNDLSRFMEEDYKAAISFKLKRARLRTLLQQATSIQKLLDESHALLSDRSHKLRTVILTDREIDSTALSIVLRRASEQISLSSASLLEVTRRLQEYITKVERASRIAKKVHLISKKIAYDTLTTETNFMDSILSYSESGIKNETYIKVDKFDVVALAEEGNFNDVLYAIANGTISGERIKKDAPAIDMAGALAPPKEGVTLFHPDYRTIFRAFRAQGRDLFSFVMDYTFPVEVGAWQRLEIYLYFCTSPQYSRSLDFVPGRSGTYNIVSPSSGRTFEITYQFVNGI